MLDSKLHTFLKVVETKSYTAAAQALHMTQPAVSQHIRKLEETYQCRLIGFSGRALMLTQAGELLYHYINLQLANEKLLIERLQSIERPLQIGATLSIADYYLPPVLTPSLASRFSLAVGNTETLIDKLLHGELDCAFIEGIFDSELFQSNIFRKACFLPVASVNHPLAGQEISLRQLHAYPLILREKGSGTRAILETYLHQQNDSIHSFAGIMEIGSFVMIKQLLAESDAVSFVYEAVAQEEVARGQLRFLKLRDYAITHALHFVYLKNSIARTQYEAFYESLR